MKTLKMIFLPVFLASCFAGGLYGGPIIKSAYAKLFPEPAFIQGDYDQLYADAGRPVVIFTTSTCPFCKKTRALLNKHNIVYTDYVTDKSPSAEKKFTQFKSSAVPLIFIGNRRILGFNETVIDAAIALIPKAPAESAP